MQWLYQLEVILVVVVVVKQEALLRLPLWGYPLIRPPQPLSGLWMVRRS